MFVARAKKKPFRVASTDDLQRFAGQYAASIAAQGAIPSKPILKIIKKELGKKYADQNLMKLQKKDITDAQVIALVDALRVAPIFSGLDLRNNRISDKGAAVLFDLMRHQVAQTSEEILPGVVNNNSSSFSAPPNIWYKAHNQFKQMTNSLRALFFLRLEGNGISDDMLKSIQKVSPCLALADSCLDMLAAVNTIAPSKQALNEEELRSVIPQLVPLDVSKKNPVLDVPSMLSQSKEVSKWEFIQRILKVRFGEEALTRAQECRRAIEPASGLMNQPQVDSLSTSDILKTLGDVSDDESEAVSSRAPSMSSVSMGLLLTSPKKSAWDILRNEARKSSPDAQPLSPMTREVIRQINSLTAQSPSPEKSQEKRDAAITQEQEIPKERPTAHADTDTKLPKDVNPPESPVTVEVRSLPPKSVAAVPAEPSVNREGSEVKPVEKKAGAEAKRAVEFSKASVSPVKADVKQVGRSIPEKGHKLGLEENRKMEPVKHQINAQKQAQPASASPRVQGPPSPIQLPGSPPPSDRIVYNLSKSSLTTLANIKNSLVHIKMLDLSSNQLQSMDIGLSAVPQLELLNLSKNNIRSISGLMSNSQLRALNISGNKIRIVVNVEHLAFLQVLDLASNQVQSAMALRSLALNKDLISVNLRDNPVALEARFRPTIIAMIPHLSVLNSVKLPPSAEQKKVHQRLTIKAAARDYTPLCPHEDEKKAMQGTWFEETLLLIHRVLYSDERILKSGGSSTQKAVVSRKEQEQMDLVRFQQGTQRLLALQAKRSVDHEEGLKVFTEHQSDKSLQCKVLPAEELNEKIAWLSKPKFVSNKPIPEVGRTVFGVRSELSTFKSVSEVGRKGQQPVKKELSRVEKLLASIRGKKTTNASNSDSSNTEGKQTLKVSHSPGGDDNTSAITAITQTDPPSYSSAVSEGANATETSTEKSPTDDVAMPSTAVPENHTSYVENIGGLSVSSTSQMSVYPMSIKDLTEMVDERLPATLEQTEEPNAELSMASKAQPSSSPWAHTASSGTGQHRVSRSLSYSTVGVKMESPSSTARRSLFIKERPADKLSPGRPTSASSTPRLQETSSVSVRKTSSSDRLASLARNLRNEVHVTAANESPAAELLPSTAQQQSELRQRLVDFEARVENADSAAPKFSSEPHESIPSSPVCTEDSLPIDSAPPLPPQVRSETNPSPHAEAPKKALSLESSWLPAGQELGPVTAETQNILNQTRIANWLKESVEHVLTGATALEVLLRLYERKAYSPEVLLKYRLRLSELNLFRIIKLPDVVVSRADEETRAKLSQTENDAEVLRCNIEMVLHAMETQSMDSSELDALIASVRKGEASKLLELCE